MPKAMNSNNGDDLFGLAVAMLRAPNAHVRREAVTALHGLGGERAAELIISTLKDSDADVRFYAVAALGDMGYKGAVLPLVWTLQNDEGEVEGGSIRLYAAMSLGNLGDERAVAALVAALGDTDPETGHWARNALVQIGAASVLPLVGALKGNNGQAVWNAAAALGDLGDARAVEALIELLPDKTLQYEGMHAHDVRARAAASLGMIGEKRSVEPLIAAVLDEDEEWPVRSAAASALGQLRDPRAVEPLIQMLSLQDTGADWSAGWYAVTGPAGMRWHAAQALGQIGDASALPALQQMLEHDKGETGGGVPLSVAAAKAIALIKAANNRD
jgi:HEAT repeat protein